MGYRSCVTIRAEKAIYESHVKEWLHGNFTYYGESALNDGSVKIVIDDVKWYDSYECVQQFYSFIEHADANGLKLAMYRTGEDWDDYETAQSDEAWEWTSSLMVSLMVEDDWE